MIIQASDGRGKASNATVEVKISRDEQPPAFDNAPYRPDTVSENAANNSGVFTVRATDPDQKVRETKQGFRDSLNGGCIVCVPGKIVYEMIGEFPVCRQRLYCVCSE